MCEEGVADDEVNLSTGINDSLLFVRSLTPCFPMTLSLFLLLHFGLAFRSDAVSWNVINFHLQ